MVRAQELINQAIQDTAAGRWDEAGAGLSELGQISDAWAMYAACTAFARAGVHALRYLWGPEFAPGSGRMLALQEPYPGAGDDDPAGAWAMRFLTAYANGDKDTATALYFTALEVGGEEFPTRVARLLRLAGELTASAMAKEIMQRNDM